MNSKIKEHKNILYTVLILLLILFFVYLIKGLFPFGENLIQEGDLYQQYTPFLYNFYDVVTGQKNIFYDFSIDGGANIFNETIVELINPVNYILLLFGRDNIYRITNIILIIYIILAGITCNFTLNKLFENKKNINIASSIIYATSTYVVYMNQIIRWMYLPVLFPLFILSLKKLIETEKGTAYSLMISYFIMLGIQNAFSLILFTFILSFVYIFKKIERERRKKIIMLLGMYTAVGILISSIALIPYLTNILDSSRFTKNSSYFKTISSTIIYTYDLFDRIMLIINPLIISLFINKIFYKKIKINYLLIIILIMIITVIYAPSNFLWHLGPYMCFPVRYAYIVNFLFCMYINENIEIDKEKINKKIYFELIGIILLIISIVLIIVNNKSIAAGFATYNILLLKRNAAYIVIVVYTCIIMANILFNQKNKMRFSMILLVAISTGFINIMMGLVNDNKYNDEYEYLLNLKQELNENETSKLTSINILNINGSLVGEYNTNSGFLPSGSKVTHNCNKEWGYYSEWIIDGELGGTVFSDSLLRVSYYVNNGTMNFPKELYKLKSKSKYNLYYNEYTFPLGIIVDDEYDIKSKSSLTYQNELSKKILKEQIFEVIDVTDKNKEKDEFTYYIEVNSPKIIYIDNLNSREIAIYVNDVFVDASVYFSTTESSPIIEVGYFEEDVKVRIEILDKIKNNKNIDVLSFDIEKFISAFENEYKNKQDLVTLNQNKITGNISLEEDKLLFIQVPNIKGWNLLVNNKKQDIKTILNGYIGIDLTKGDNKIELTFTPLYFKEGLITTILGIISLILLIIFKNKLVDIKSLNILAYYIFIIIACILTIIIYVIPIIVSIISSIIKIFI